MGAGLIDRTVAWSSRIASPQEVEISSTLICYDGSPSAQHALVLAYRSLDERPKVLLTVWSTPERVHADSFGFDQHGDGRSRMTRPLSGDDRFRIGSRSRR
jgi:hypothetical protein